jgi:hypothetical protein
MKSAVVEAESPKSAAPPLPKSPHINQIRFSLNLLSPQGESAECLGEVVRDGENYLAH